MSDRIAVMREGKLAGIIPGAGATEEQVMILAAGVSGGARLTEDAKRRTDSMSTKASKEGTASSSRVSFGRRLLEQRELSIFLVVLLVAIFLNFASPNFLSRANLTALVLGLSFNAIVAVGMTVLLISGGFDLSVGATLALAGAAAGYAMTKLDVSAPVAILFGLGTGAFVGLLNGLIIAKVGVNALIATLGICRWRVGRCSC